MRLIASARLLIIVAVVLGALYRNDLKGAVTTPTTQKHKVEKSHVTLISPLGNSHITSRTTFIIIIRQIQSFFKGAIWHNRKPYTGKLSNHLVFFCEHNFGIHIFLVKRDLFIIINNVVFLFYLNHQQSFHFIWNQIVRVQKSLSLIEIRAFNTL